MRFNERVLLLLDVIVAKAVKGILVYRYRVLSR